VRYLRRQVSSEAANLEAQAKNAATPPRRVVVLSSTGYAPAGGFGRDARRVETINRLTTIR
jgi:hypothetical protein